MGDDYPNEPRLRDLSFSLLNLPKWLLLTLIRGVPGCDITHITAQYLPFLPKLFALRIPGDL